MMGPFSRKQIQQDREEYIFQVVEEMLQEKSYYEMSMDEVAARVGISKVTLYRHFKSKEDLIFSLFFRHVPHLLKEMDQLMLSDLPVIPKIESMMKMSIYHSLQKESTLSLSFISSLGELPIFLKSKQHELEKIEQTIAAYLLPLLEEGQSKGVIDVSIPPELLMRTFFGVISSVHLQKSVSERTMSNDELAEVGARLYMKAVRA